MNSENKEKVVGMLMTFLEKATGTNASKEEIAIIPEVAKILLGII